MGCPHRVVVLPKNKAGQHVQTLELQNARRRSKKERTRSYAESARAYAHYLHGRLEAMEGRRKEAIASFKMALVYDPSSAFLYFCIAQQYLKAKKLLNASFWAKRALKQNPNYAPAHHLLGQSYWMGKQPRLSLRSLEKAVQSSPTFLKAYLDLDNILQTMREPQKKREVLLSQMIKHLPQSHEGYMRLGQIFEEAGLLKKAVGNYKEALNRYPSHTTVLFLLARLYERRMDWGKSIHYYRELLGYQPDEWLVRVRLGAVFLKRGKAHDSRLADYQFSYIQREATRFRPEIRLYLIGKELYLRGRSQESIGWLRKAIKKRKNFSMALYYLGLSYKQLGKTTLALKTFREITPSSKVSYFDAQVQKIELLVAQNRVSEARQILRKTRAQFQINPNRWSRLSQAFVERAPLVEVGRELDLLKPLLQRWPANDGLLYHQAYLFFKQKKSDLCQRTLLKLLKRNAAHAPALNFLGYIYAEGGRRLKEARQLVRKALQLDPGNAYYLDSLGWIYVRLGEHAKARRILEDVRRRLPKEATVLFHLARLYHRVGEFKRALKLYRDVQSLNPGPSLQRKVQTQIQQLSRTLSKNASGRAPNAPKTGARRSPTSLS